MQRRGEVEGVVAATANLGEREEQIAAVVLDLLGLRREERGVLEMLVQVWARAGSRPGGGNE